MKNKKTNGMPAGFADGVDNVGITNEVDQQVDDAMTLNFVPRWDVTNLVSGNIYNDPAGNIGIGTISPMSKLQVGDAYGLTLNPYLDNNADGAIFHNAYVVSGVYKWLTTHPAFGSRGIQFGYGSGDGIKFYADRAASTAGSNFTPTERMRISNEGNVGIGTANPGYKLHVIGSSSGGDGMVFGNSYHNYGFWNPAADIHTLNIGVMDNSVWTGINIWNNGAVRMRINPDGNVGIGTPSPAYKLDVNGNGGFNGNLSIKNGNSLMTLESGANSGNAVLQYMGSGAGDYAKLEAGDYYAWRPVVLAPSGGNIGIGTVNPAGHKLFIDSNQGGGGNSALKIIYAGGTSALGELAALAHRNGDWSTLYVNGAGGSLSYAMYVEGNKPVIFNAGNVGIGTATPAKLLTLSAPSTGNGPAIRLQTAGPGNYRWDLEGGNEYFKLYSADTPIITAHYNGNVGIGTPSPAAKLDVNGDGIISGPLSVAGILSVTGTNIIQVMGTNIITMWPHRDMVENLNADMVDGKHASELGGITVETDPQVGANTENYVPRWYGGPAGALVSGSIYNDLAGNVGIGITSPEAKLDVNGNAVVRGSVHIYGGDNGIRSYGAGGYMNSALIMHAYELTEPRVVLIPDKYGFRITDHGNEWINFEFHDYGDLFVQRDVSARDVIERSDARTKFDQRPLDYGLAQIMALEPKRYNRAEYNHDLETGELVIHPEKTTNDIGLVAQELQKIIPEAVNVPEDETRETWGIAYSKLISVLVKAIQEQQAQIEALKQEKQALAASGTLPDTTLTADFDGDGKADTALVSATGGWYLWLSGSGYVKSGPYNLGMTGKPVAADYDGDGKADPGIVDSNGNLYVWLSASGYSKSKL